MGFNSAFRWLKIWYSSCGMWCWYGIHMYGYLYQHRCENYPSLVLWFEVPSAKIIWPHVLICRLTFLLPIIRQVPPLAAIVRYIRTGRGCFRTVCHSLFAYRQFYGGGTLWRSWLRHCATNRKVAGSIPNSLIGIFHWHNPSGRTIALGLTQPLTEMSTRNISWGVKAADA